MNKADSERISTLLEKKGYKRALKIEQADLIVVNMCSIRQQAVDRIYGLFHKLKKLKNKNPKLKTVLTGCITKEDKINLKKMFDDVWKNDYIDIIPKERNDKSALIPISNGCNNFCSYCIVPFTRGPLVCRSHKDILKEAKKAIKEGSKEIWLLGQNVNDYQSSKDKSINFPKLLKMVANLKGDFSLRFTSPNPKNFSDELILTMAESKKISKYLNLPIQSGDDTILKKMNRPYKVKQYKELVKKIREKMPEINLSTDVIVGFPGETEKQFQNTVNLFKELRFSLAYINKYSPRPGTKAATFKDDFSREEKKTREKTLQNIIQKLRKERIIVVLGPTASGKSDLAVDLAKKFNGEIISADSRQVYKGMDLGSGKITEKEAKGIPHYLLDVVSPKKRFSVAEYKKLAQKAIEKIINKGKIPIVCGGSAFYIYSLIDGITTPEVSPNWSLRKKLEKESAEKLFLTLKKLDPKRAKTIESKNKRRLIRALEIILTTKKQVPLIKNNPLPYPVLFVGVKKDSEELKKRIEIRLEKRLKQGMIAEVKKLKELPLSWKRLEEFGLEYKYIALYLQEKLSKEEMTEQLQRAIEKFVKRQMNWFKRDQRIRWIKNRSEAGKLASQFLGQHK
jgi:tRNA dimethylallyltransferase